MTFSQRMELEREYREWVAKESEKFTTPLDHTRFSTMLVFLKHKGLLKGE